MIQTEEQFFNYHKAQFGVLEHANDHPAGIIASFLVQNHHDEQNVAGFEHKVRNELVGY